MTGKTKIYAIFQFITFISYFIFGLTFLLIFTYNDSEVENIAWFNILKMILSFSDKSIGKIATSILIYLAFLLVLASWIIGFQIVRTEDRNLFDQLFILFVFVPLLSNVLCFLAQFSSNKVEISYHVGKVDKKKEYTKQYNLISQQKERELKELKRRLHELKKKD